MSNADKTPTEEAVPLNILPPNAGFAAKRAQAGYINATTAVLEASFPQGGFRGRDAERALITAKDNQRDAHRQLVNALEQSCPGEVDEKMSQLNRLISAAHAKARNTTQGIPMR